MSAAKSVPDRLAQIRKRRLDDADTRAAIIAKRKQILEQGVQPVPDTAPAELRALVEAAEWLGDQIKNGDQGDLNAAAEELDKKARKAARAGYADHPLMEEWKAGRRSLGERDALRKLKNELPAATHGISPRLDLVDVWLRLAVEKIMADSKVRLTIAEIQQQALALCEAEWRPDVMKNGMVHEDARRMQAGRSTTANALKKEAVDAWKHLLADVGKRLEVKERAFADWLIGLGLHEPRARRR